MRFDLQVSGRRSNLREERANERESERERERTRERRKAQVLFIVNKKVC